MNERVETKVCGRVIGSSTGWDEADTFAIQFYDFEPVSGVAIPACSCLVINFDTGLVYNGEPDFMGDLVTLLRDIAT